MQPLKFLTIVPLVAALAATRLEAQNGPAVEKSPNADTIRVVGRNGSWTVAELDRGARDYLISKGVMTNQTIPEALVRVLLTNKTTMCEILYLQGFGKPFWQVKIGFDGKPTGFTTAVAVEGGLGRERPGSPATKGQAQQGEATQPKKGAPQKGRDGDKAGPE